MRTLTTLVVLMLMTSFVYAQKTVSGTIVDTDGESLIGVNILEAGTSNGTVTDLDGAFKLDVQEDATIVISYIGYETQKIKVADQSSFSIVLMEGVALSEVVVTALGISREKKSLGYSVANLDSKDFNEVKSINVANSLAGKVAGVQINKTSSGPTGSTRVVIRGNSSILGNNQPLYVVDGVPLNNDNVDAAGRWGGVDYGDNVSDINPIDIENISVLKGPNAAVLYGSQAANGVILISTKKGKKQKGIGVTLNSSLTFDSPLVYPEMQNEYGHGSGGISDGLATYGTDANQSSSWGARMDGSQQVFFDGQTRAFNPQPDNLKNFYQTGKTFTNSLSFVGGNDMGGYRLSMSNLQNEGIIPTSTFDRNTVSIGTQFDVSSKLFVGLIASYVDQKAHNRPYLSDAIANPGRELIWMPRSVDLSLIEDYKNDDGTMHHYNDGTFRQNPYWSIHENINEDSKQRFFGTVNLGYRFTDWLSLEGRLNRDQYHIETHVREALNTRYIPGGRVRDLNHRTKNTYADLIAKASPKLLDNISTSFTLGTSRMNIDYKNQGSLYEEFNDLGTTDGFYNISNAKSPITPLEAFSKKRINSVFGILGMGYKSFLFLDLSLRNDWSSTLPAENNSYLYSGVNASFVFTEILNSTGPLSFGKLRFSWAKVGSDTDPYQLDPLYSLRSGTINGQPVGYIGTYGPQSEISAINIPPVGLEPEATKSFEIGTELNFWSNRILLDITYYNAKTENQIIPAQIPFSSGYTGALVNAGEVSNSGIEVLLNAGVLNRKDLSLNLILNFSNNNNRIDELYGDLESVLLGNDRAVNIEARPGNAYGDIVGIGYLRDASGNIVVGADGLPLASPTVQVLGNNTPDWIAGAGLDLNFKGISLRSLFDIRMGGQLYSQSSRYMYRNGNHIETLEGRDGDFLIEGSQVAQIDADVPVIDENNIASTSGANTTYVNAEDWWTSVFNQNIIDDFVYDASFVKFRELSIGYNLPQSLLGESFLKRANISLVGRNLAILSSDIKGFDPEASFNSGNAQGMESGAIPSTRSIGVNLTLGF